MRSVSLVAGLVVILDIGGLTRGDGSSTTYVGVTATLTLVLGPIRATVLSSEHGIESWRASKKG
jgi:hypothetical protein